MKNQMKILTRHLLIRRAFREKCIYTDYNERVFVFDLIYSLSSNLKLSIDIFLYFGFPVAQMVEHGASNAKIMGSIPRESKS